jgi:hypothetical protein
MVRGYLDHNHRRNGPESVVEDVHEILARTGVTLVRLLAGLMDEWRSAGSDFALLRCALYYAEQLQQAAGMKSGAEAGTPGPE